MLSQTGLAQKGLAQKGFAQKRFAQKGLTQKGLTQNGLAQKRTCSERIFSEYSLEGCHSVAGCGQFQIFGIVVFAIICIFSPSNLAFRQK
jgi:hypothetical protein